MHHGISPRLHELRAELLRAEAAHQRLVRTAQGARTERLVRAAAALRQPDRRTPAGRAQADAAPLPHRDHLRQHLGHTLVRLGLRLLHQPASRSARPA